MLRSIQLGRLFGIGIYVHPTWFLLPLWAFLMGNEAVSYGFYLALLVAVFGCVILHELGHALTARRFGIRTRDITLYPIGGVARLERMSDKPWEEFWIAIGGPAVNVIIVTGMTLLAVVAALGGLGVAGTPGLHAVTGFLGQTAVGQFLICLLIVNVMLVLFNMLPAFPMDGGRVFRSLLALWLGQLQATRIAAAVGIVLAVLLGVAGFALSQPVIVAIALFVVLAGQLELRGVEARYRPAFEPPLPQAPPPVYRNDVVEMYPSGPTSYGPDDGFTIRPNVAVYVWDKEAGVWVREPRLSEQ